MPITALALRLDATSYDQLPRAVIETLQRNPLGLMGILSAGVFFLKALQKIAERWTTDEGAIKAVLDSAHKVYFEKVAKAAPEQLHYHRVTLFRARRRLRDLDLLHPLKWRRCLKVFGRSGTAYQKSSTVLAIDDEKEEANEGVAGRAWFTNGQCSLCDLPEWPNPCPERPEDETRCTDYAAKSGLPVQKAKALKVKSRSVGAHVVRTPTGDRWGVVVFDSRDPQGVSETDAKKALMELTAILLTQLVGR